MCRPTIARSRSIPSSRAIRGSNPQRSKPSRSNNLRLGSLCAKIRPTMALIPSDDARAIASSNSRRADATAPELFIDVIADFGCAAVGTARQEFLEVQPADNAAVAFRHPEWILIRRVLVEPRQ